MPTIKPTWGLSTTELNGDMWDRLKPLRRWLTSWSSPAFSHQHLLPPLHSLGSPPPRSASFLLVDVKYSKGKVLPHYCYRWFPFSKESWSPLKARSFKLLKAIWQWHVRQQASGLLLGFRIVLGVVGKTAVVLMQHLKKILSLRAFKRPVTF